MNANSFHCSYDWVPCENAYTRFSAASSTYYSNPQYAPRLPAQRQSLAKVYKMRRRLKKQLARETAKHIAMVKESREKAGLETETILLAHAAKSAFCFRGQLLIQPEEAAISKAIELSHCSEEQLTFFTDGAVHISSSMVKKQNALHRGSSKHAQCGSRGLKIRRDKVKLAAAIAYQASENSEWTVKFFQSLKVKLAFSFGLKWRVSQAL